MPATQKLNAPRHLSAASRRWWTFVVTRWELDPHHCMLLTLAGETWDRGQQARRQIDCEGLTTSTRDGGVKLHPAARVEDACQLRFARLLRELDLDIAPPVEAKRIPPL